jgi:RHS repeat-associated protein
VLNAAISMDSLSYTNLGQPLQYKMGTSGEPAYVTDSYDPQTGRVTEQDTQTGTASTSVDDLHYTYDHVGDVTSEADTPPGSSATDVQCFQYDYLGRMTQAWAQGSAGCAATPSASAEGGAAPYWETYSYAATGDMTGITATTPAGAVTTTTDTYPAAGAAQPHGISTQKVTTSTGSTTTSYGYDTAGHLTTLTSTAQNEALTWNDQGQLAQAAITPSGGSAKDTSYIYDANSTLLLTADPTAKTLYLGDEEITENTGTSAVTGTRYYTLGGTAVAARTGAAALAYLAGDQQGTSSVAIDSGTLAVTHRYYDPYGNARGTAQPAWPEGEKGFVGGANDTATGLTDLGAREYQPGTGSFISPDPLLNPYQPQDLNAYAYAYGNPATDSDPSGAMAITDGGGGGASSSAQVDCAGAGKQVAQCDQPKGKTSPPADQPGTGSRMICNGNVCASVPYWHEHPQKPAPVTRPSTTAKPEFSCGGPDANFKGWKGTCQAAQSKKPVSWKTLGLAGLTLLNIVQLGGDPVTDALELAELGDLTAEQVDEVEELEQEEAATCGGQSFTAGTKVLLASGAAVPIAALKPGDKVLATNVTTGKTQPEAIAAVLVHHDTNLYDLKVKAGHRTTVIHTTASHLFWDPYLHYGWTPAKHLKPGMHLKTPDGQSAVVVGGSVPAVHDGWMWDLTVPGNNDHDFYVVASDTSVLVHNSGGIGDCPTSDSGPEQTVHGAERAADPSRLDPAAQADVIANPTQTLSQADGAQVYVQQVGDRYNVVVQGNRGVITNLKNLSQKSFNRLARNYGWTPN